MITIKTSLDSGIYKSSGGGEVRARYEWTTGPRNLLSAIRQLSEHRDDMTRGYGNIGCGRSWLEIDGITMSDLTDILTHDAVIFRGCEAYLPMKPPTQKARDVLANVAAYSQDAEAAALADVEHAW